jgi:hypothetical protein
VLQFSRWPSPLPGEWLPSLGGHYTSDRHVFDGRCGPLRDHRTPRPHTCDQRCKLPACTPLKLSSPLKVLSIISAALSLAKRYKWVDSNVAEDATMPSAGRPQPNPPTPEQAARLINVVYAEDEKFGLYLWTSFTPEAVVVKWSACAKTGLTSTCCTCGLPRTTWSKEGSGSRKPQRRRGPLRVPRPAHLRT